MIRQRVFSTSLNCNFFPRCYNFHFLHNSPYFDPLQGSQPHSFQCFWPHLFPISSTFFIHFDISTYYNLPHFWILQLVSPNWMISKKHHLFITIIQFSSSLFRYMLIRKWLTPGLFPDQASLGVIPLSLLLEFCSKYS